MVDGHTGSFFRALMVGSAIGSLSLPATLHFFALCLVHNLTTVPDWDGRMRIASLTGWALGLLGGSVWVSLRLRQNREGESTWDEGCAAWFLALALHILFGIFLLPLWLIVSGWTMAAAENLATALGAR